KQGIPVMPKVFISYARVDMDRALELEQVFIANSMDVWRDQHSVYAGEQWPRAIGEAIADCDAVLLLWSADSAASHFVEFEWTTALALKKTIIPCLLDYARLPPGLAAINNIDCRNIDEAGPLILAALPDESQPGGSERRTQVIAQLERVTAAEPDEALSQARALFTQSNLNVGAHLIQGAAAQAPIREIRRHFITILVALFVIVIIVLAVFYFASHYI
ncbi:MAG TPA: toll/interleukin-1 receptor domain-containing protein, partial [Blastocatellia bacterium]|nr:toll/interleukin-1 receptor domain-containing protein [Blastocatellia bacterium]